MTASVLIRPSRPTSRLLAAFAALAVCGPALAADDLLEKEKKRQEVTAQKAEADFRAAVRELHRLEAKDAGKAAEQYRRLLTALEDDAVLAESKREAWKRMIRDRLRVMETESTQAAQDAARQAGAEERKTVADAKARDDARQQGQIESVRRLQREGLSEEAAKAASELTGRAADSPAGVAARRITSAAKELNDLRAMRAERSRANLTVLRETERGATPPRGDIEFPPPEKWREITKRRSKDQNMTETEKAILRALETAYTINFEGAKFEAAIDYLQTLTGATIAVDKATLDAAGITYETPLKTKGRQITLRTLLRKMLGEFNLTYVVKDQAIQIVTPDRAKEMLTTRTYYLGDLAFSTNYQFGAAFTPFQMAAGVTNLMQMITGTVDPDSWAVNNAGGRGTIIFEPASMSLIVKQNAEVHYMLGGFGK